ncbi:DUF1700 domain-containing protein [Bacillus spongiae]|uniref:DUF1700 domain-containing protein n=1 Tax=Bacillus spongiae TaxID=2683610 RepID=A0ABU8HE00_9BACI
MTKEEYLQRLDMALVDVRPERRTEVIDYYRRRIELGFSYEKDVDEMVNYLGTPEEVAEKIIKEEQQPDPQPIKRKEPSPPSPPSPSSAGHAILVIGLMFFTLVIVLGPALGFAGAIIGFFSAAIALLFSGVMILFAEPIGALLQLDVNVAGLSGGEKWLTLIFASMLTVGLGLLFWAFSVWLGKGYLFVVKQYYHWMRKVVRGDSR